MQTIWDFFVALPKIIESNREGRQKRHVSPSKTPRHPFPFFGKLLSAFFPFATIIKIIFIDVNN